MMRRLVAWALLCCQVGADLIEGDIAVEDSLSSSSASNSFIRDPNRLWPNGRVHYRFDVDQGGDILTDDQKTMITEVLDYFEEEVPCLNFE